MKTLALLLPLSLAGCLRARPAEVSREASVVARVPEGAQVRLLAAPGGVLGSTLEALALGGPHTLTAGRFQLAGTAGYAAEPEALHTVELWGPRGSAPALRFVSEERVVRAALSRDGEALVLATAGGLEGRSGRDGRRRWRVAFPATNLALLRDGGVVAAAGARVLALDPSGAERWGATLEGTAWGQQRIYTGEGTHHLTREVRVPAAIHALAVDEASGDVAVGLSDATVRVLHHGREARAETLPSAWPPSPPSSAGRGAGALGLGWSRGALYALQATGALVRLGAGDAGASLVHDGSCSDEEAEVVLRGLGADRTPYARRHFCEAGFAGLFSADGASVLEVVSHGLRVRAVSTGAPLRAVSTLGRDHVALREDGRSVVLGNLASVLRERSLADFEGPPLRVFDLPGTRGGVLLQPSADLLVAVRSEGIADEQGAAPPARLQGYHLDGRPRGLTATNARVVWAPQGSGVVGLLEVSGALRVVDLEGAERRRFEAPVAQAQFRYAHLLDGGRAALLSADARLFFLREGAAPRELEAGDARVVAAVAADARGERALVTRFDAGTFRHVHRVLELRTGAVLRELSTPLATAALSEDGARIATVDSNEEGVVLREVSSGRELGRPGAAGRGLCFAPEGGLLYGTTDGIYLWTPGSAARRVGPPALLPEMLAEGRWLAVHDGDSGAHLVELSAGAHRATFYSLSRGGFVSFFAGSARLGGSAELRASLVLQRADGRLEPLDEGVWRAVYEPSRDPLR